VINSTGLQKDVILLVDDVITNSSILFDFLTEAGFSVLVAQDGVRAIQKAERAQPDLILLDVMMPNMNGFDVCKHLKSQALTEEIPIIFMTALSSTEDKLKGFEVGAADYITKPIQYEEVLARVNAHLNIRRLQRQLKSRTIELEQQYLTSEQERKAAEAASCAKTAFLTNMNHELRTPLNAILGYGDILREIALKQECSDVLSNVERIISSADQLLDIISDVLALSKVEADKMELNYSYFSIEILIDTITTMVQPALKKNNNKLFINNNITISCLYSDQLKVQKVLQNIMSNAVKFTHNGSITLDVYVIEQWLYFKLTDTGIGITRAQLENIFLPFYQSDNSITRQYGGTGLGLTLSKHFCMMLEGDIYIESCLHEGSIVTVRFPIQTP